MFVFNLMLAITLWKMTACVLDC